MNQEYYSWIKVKLTKNLKLILLNKFPLQLIEVLKSLKRIRIEIGVILGFRLSLENKICPDKFR